MPSTRNLLTRPDTRAWRPQQDAASDQRPRGAVDEHGAGRNDGGSRS